MNARLNRISWIFGLLIALPSAAGAVDCDVLRRGLPAYLEDATAGGLLRTVPEDGERRSLILIRPKCAGCKEAVLRAAREGTRGPGPLAIFLRGRPDEIARELKALRGTPARFALPSPALAALDSTLETTPATQVIVGKGGGRFACE